MGELPFREAANDSGFGQIVDIAEVGVEREWIFAARYDSDAVTNARALDWH